MRLALTLLLAAVVALLTGHLAVVSFFPSVIASHYPTVVSRVYDSKSGAANQEGAARLDAIDGRPGIMRVTLTKGAVERLALETVAVIEKPVQRTASVAGVVLAIAAVPKSIAGDLPSSALVVRAPLSGAADKPASGEPATIIPLAQGRPAARGGATGQSARLIGIGSEDAASGAPPSAYYILSGENQELQAGHHVIVQLPLVGNGAVRKIVPASAIIYDASGRTWVYANPGPQVFVREPVDIAVMEAETAILDKGPPAGALVVKTGAFELYGAESAIGIDKVAH